MTTYMVTVTHDDDLWVATIDGLPPHVVGAADYPQPGADTIYKHLGFEYTGDTFKTAHLRP